MDITLKTPRLTLKRLEIEDASNMYAYAKERENTRYLTWKRHESLQHTQEIIQFLRELIRKGENDGFAIHEESAGMIGTIGMRWKTAQKGEIGYCLAKPYWNKGYVTEAAKSFVAYLWERYAALQTIEARCFAGHDASANIMQKLGMKFIGFLPDERFINLDEEKLFHVWHYSMKRST